MLYFSNSLIEWAITKWGHALVFDYKFTRDDGTIVWYAVVHAEDMDKEIGVGGTEEAAKVDLIEQLWETVQKASN